MAFNSEIRHQKTANRLYELISRYGMKPADLSNVTGISRALISRYLSGEYAPSRKNAVKLAEILHVDPEWLRGNDGIQNVNKLTEYFNALNDIGKDRVLEYMELLSTNEKFRREE